MIRQLGSHLGKNILFGFDRYLLPELDDYNRILGRYGTVVPAAMLDNLHYLTSAQNLCSLMQDHEESCAGVLICGTGMGMSIAANKFRGIYAARCLSTEDAEMSRTINNANVLCLAVKSGITLNEHIIDSFMTTAYEGRKLEQLEFIAQMELETEPAPRVPALSLAQASRKSA
jgi:ribose 5-phosphate isomerase B